jgi:CubicO group peptidase (beta-lactamase class C family)
MIRSVWLRCLVVVAVSLGVAASVSAGQAKPSSTVIGAEQRSSIEKAGAAAVVALNAGRAADWLALFAQSTRTTVGDERLSGQFTRIRETVGPLEFHHAELREYPVGAQQSRVLHVFAKSTKENRWKNFQLAVEPNAPYRIDQLAFIADVAEPVYLPNADLPDPNTKKWLEAYIDQLVKTEDLSGSVLVTKGAQTIMARTFGYADAGRTRPITAYTRFSMASSSKMFTAVLVAKLVEAGRLSYGDTIGRFFPEPETPAAWSGVTVDQLLSHNSGVGEYWTAEFTAARQSIRTLGQFLPWIYKAGMTFEPGKGHRYSNSNFILLGLIIERVTGRTYEEELRRALLLPAKLTSTSLVSDPLPASRDAQTLARDGQGWKPSGLPGWGSSADGGRCRHVPARAGRRAVGVSRHTRPHDHAPQ